MNYNTRKKNTRIVAGVDIGAATAKSVIFKNNKILAFSIRPTGFSVAKIAYTVAEEALKQAGISIDEVEYVVSTGYGRRAVSFANKVVPEIICHAAGVGSVIPEARTIIDIGGQDSKVIGLDDNGSVSNFVMNDKCAAGTGRFLDVMAGALEIDISEIGNLSLLGKDPCEISSTCTVFAESEMVSLRAEGKSRENILAGIHKALVRRVAIAGAQVGFKKELVFTGGVAKNVGIKKAFEYEIGLDMLVPEEPQIMGALGAAILASLETE